MGYCTFEEECFSEDAAMKKLPSRVSSVLKQLPDQRSDVTTGNASHYRLEVARGVHKGLNILGAQRVKHVC